MKVVIIIPTYNENENIAPLITALQKVFQELPYDMNILIVDDNSPDGTAQTVKDLMRRSSNIHLITGRKQGLGLAYMRGMKYALDVLRATVIVEMDADFSHNPADVPLMIKTLEKGYDFIIGSRYVQGGKIPEDWGFTCRMISLGGNMFARYVGGLHEIHDCTAGFRAIHASVLKKIDLTKLGVKGYAFQVALLSWAVANHALIKEIPVEFVNRIRGETKIGISDIIEFITLVWSIRFRKIISFNHGERG